ncbi:MAG: hypothetical protein D6740_05605 [Alphaproteobacteria bacterium]|nr:MAG: hypothetical protein D6740_05605 [Alphaproteobacteria bacterium]
MSWSDVGQWLKNNAGKGAALVGSLVSGNIPGAVAAGVALVSSATGTDDPEQALAELQSNPDTLLKLKQLAVENEKDIRRHMEAMHLAELQDRQAEHHEQQETIRAGDRATDEYVRRTRPKMARQSWWATIAYVIGFEAAHAFGLTQAGASMDLAMILLAPAAAYIGFRTWDKWGKARFAGVANG